MIKHYWERSVKNLKDIRVPLDEQPQGNHCTHIIHTKVGERINKRIYKSTELCILIFDISAPFFCVLCSSPYIRLRSENSIHQVFWSHPPNRKQAFPSLPVIIIFIDFPCQSEVTNLDYPRTGVVFPRYKAIPRCQIPMVEVTFSNDK